MNTRKPITRHRSSWVDITKAVDQQMPVIDGAEDVAYFERRVTDGSLRCIRARELGALHLSISWVGNSERQAKRYPRWDEIADARDTLLPQDLEFHMVLPKAEEYVAVHDTTFHLHESPPIESIMNLLEVVTAERNAMLERLELMKIPDVEMIDLPVRVVDEEALAEIVDPSFTVACNRDDCEWTAKGATVDECVEIGQAHEAEVHA